MRTEVFIVEENMDGLRIDKAVAEAVPDLSRSYIQKVILDGGVKVNGVIVGKSFKPAKGSKIEVIVPEAEELEIIPQPIPLDIVYEDSDLLVVNKPKGIVVHPAPGNLDRTLVNALMHHCKDELSCVNGKIRAGIVHRLDKDTSGLLLAAKNDFTHNSLAAQLKSRNVKRVYRAVVLGKLKSEQGVIDAPIGRSAKNRKKMCVTQTNSKSAQTNYRVLEGFSRYSHVELELVTGRTHQIRVHMAWLGHPVAGDTVYGPPGGEKDLKGQCLHAKTLGFTHPRSNDYMEISSELPDYFSEFIGRIK